MQIMNFMSFVFYVYYLFIYHVVLLDFISQGYGLHHR